MKRLILIVMALALMSPTAVFARGSKKTPAWMSRITEKGRDFVTFTIPASTEAVKMNVIGDVVYRQSDRCEVRITGVNIADSHTPRLIDSDAGNLTLMGRNGEALVASRIEIYAPNIGMFLLYGTSTLDVGKVKTPRLCLKVYGVQDIKVDDINVDGLNVQVLGQSSIVFGKVKASKSEVEIAGVADMSFREITGTTVVANVSGQGSANFGNVSANRLRITVSGIASLKVRGKVDLADIIVTGLGEVDTSGLKARKMVNYNNLSSTKQETLAR